MLAFIDINQFGTAMFSKLNQCNEYQCAKSHLLLIKALQHLSILVILKSCSLIA